MNLQILIQRECVRCGGTVNTTLYFDGSPEAQAPINSECECGCTIQISLIGIIDNDIEN